MIARGENYPYERYGTEPASDPTPDQIRQRAAAIRKKWNQRTRQRRIVGEMPGWLPPLIRLDSLVDPTEN